MDSPTSLLTRALLSAIVLFYLGLELYNQQGALVQPCQLHAQHSQHGAQQRARAQPHQSQLLSLNASALQRAALRSPPPPPQAAFSPFDSYQRALGYTRLSPPEVLRCLASVGGLALVGDSMLREATTVLLEYLGRPRIKVQGVPWAQQRADEQFEVPLEDGSTASAQLFFRFAQNIHPELGSRVAEVALQLGVRVVVATSGVWDLMPDSGASAADGLARYQRGAARFLEGLRTDLAPQLAGLDAQSGGAAPPRRFFWRTASPTVFGRLDDVRRQALPPGALHAGNVFMRQALRAAAEAGGVAWEVVDMETLMPSAMEGLIREDGYHPTDESALATIMVVLNALCAPALTADTLAQLAA